MTRRLDPLAAAHLAYIEALRSGGHAYCADYVGRYAAEARLFTEMADGIAFSAMGGDGTLNTRQTETRRAIIALASGDKVAPDDGRKHKRKGKRKMKAALIALALLCSTPVYAGQFAHSSCQIGGNTVLMTLDRTNQTATATAMIPGFTHKPLPSLYAYNPGQGISIIDHGSIWFIADPESGKTSFLSAFGGTQPMLCTKFADIN